MYTRKDFGTPPPGYVGGVGRGAISFTTRSDIGPAENKTRAPPPSAPTIAGLSSYDESQFDKFSGFNEKLFSGVSMTKDDVVAEKIFKAIHHRMDSKRKARREQLEEKHKNISLDVYELFKEDKKALSQLSLQDWESLPESGQHTKRPKKVSRSDKFTPVPDLIIHASHERSLQNIDRGGTITPLAPSPLPGTATPVDLTQLGNAREKVLDMTLGKLSDSVDGQTVVDPKGYLTDLRTKSFSAESDISDIEKARTLFKSITSTNPKNAPGWVGAARLEEFAGKLKIARKLALQGCDECPRSEDVWIEAARLHNPHKGRAIIARAVSFLPKSEKLWLRAAKLEPKVEGRREVFQKALQQIPNSANVWKAAIELEEEGNARIMLSKAVKCVPQDVEMWLALTRLETNQNAKQVLNEARHALPSEPKIWITAARLEESSGVLEAVPRIIAKGLRSLKTNGVIIDRDFWIKEAYGCEKSGSPGTCQAIVREVIGVGIEEADRRLTWKADADTAIKLGHIETARAIFGHMLSVFPKKSQIWWSAAMLEKEKGTHETLCTLLAEAVKQCAKSEAIWLCYAKEKWNNNKTEEAREILEQAFNVNKNSEAICLAAVKLEFESKKFAKARQVLQRSMGFIKKPRIWMKAAILERELNKSSEEEKILKEGVSKFKTFSKLWIMYTQFLWRSGRDKEARSNFQLALKYCPKSVPIWSCYAQFEAERSPTPAKARSLLETAKMRIPKSTELWLQSVRLEAKHEKAVAQRLLSKALQQCPKSGQLWAYGVELEIKQKRRGKCHDALKALEDDAFVYLEAAKLFWSERKAEKAKNWFERAVKADSDLGEAWAFYYSFLLKNGTEAEQRSLKERCVAAEPRHGEKWIYVSKKTGNLRLKTDQILEIVANGIKI